MSDGQIDELVNSIKNGKCEISHNSITDFPKIILYKGEECGFCVEMTDKIDKKFTGKEYKEDYTWRVCYKNLKTHEIVFETSDIDLDTAFMYMHHRFNDLSKNIRLPNGDLVRSITLFLSNIREYSVVSKHHVMRSYPEEDKMKMFNRCPYCGSENRKSEYYKSSPESWASLAGREGYTRVCQDCGYTVDDIICMS